MLVAPHLLTTSSHVESYWAATSRFDQIWLATLNEMTCIATAWQHVICVTDVLDPSRSYLLCDWWHCSLSTSHASEWQKHRLTTAPKPILRRINRSSAQCMQGKPPIMLSHNPAVTMWILLQCILYIPLDNLHKPLNHPNCGGLVTSLYDPNCQAATRPKGPRKQARYSMPRPFFSVEGAYSQAMLWYAVQTSSCSSANEAHSWAPNKTAWWNNCWTVLTLLDVDCDRKKHPTLPTLGQAQIGWKKITWNHYNV